MTDYSITTLPPLPPPVGTTKIWAPTAASAYPAYVAPVRPDTDSMPILDVDGLPKNIFWEVLGKALTMRRDFESQTESEFVSWLTTKIGSTMIDAAGNLHVDQRTADGTSRTLFTAHTDTVHNGGGKNTVRVDGKFWRADKGAALGADDGSGVAILSYMIESGVPGYYVFFRGEERGGVGSKYLSDKMPKLFKGHFDRAVAFDRAGYYDVITRQAGGKCCSDEFAEALAEQLSTDTNFYLPCSGGVYTDTAEFIDLIPECTNISVGYKNQHGDMESQDVEFLWELAQIAVGVAWDELPTVRDPNAKPVYATPSYGKWNAKTKKFEWPEDDVYSYYDDMRRASEDDKPVSVYKGISLRDGVEDLSVVDDGPGELPLYDIDEDSDEFMLLMAIEEFRSESDQQFLLDLIADAVYPEDPSAALRNMRKAWLQEEELAAAELQIHQGWNAYGVLIELYDLISMT